LLLFSVCPLKEPHTMQFQVKRVNAKPRGKSEYLCTHTTHFWGKVTGIVSLVGISTSWG
jgi:hypothetical protein